MIISVVSGGSVVQTHLPASAKGAAVHINAVEGARYILADSLGGGAVAGMVVKRVGRNLIISQDSEDAGLDALIIEDFHGSGGQLVAQGVGGEYLEYVAVTESGAVHAADLVEGGSSLLALMTAAPAAGFEFSEGGSSLLGGALASAAAMAGGLALSTGKSGGSKASAAPAASAFMLDDKIADVAPGRLTPAAVEAGAAAAVQESASAVDTANNVPADIGAEATSARAPESAPAAIVPLAAGGIPVIEKIVDDHGAITGTIEDGGYTDDGYPTIMGSADPGVRVHVYRGKYLLGFTDTDASGKWKFTPSSPLSTGKHSITVIYEYPDTGVSEESEPYVIRVDKVAPGIPQITGIVDDEGRITGAITDQTITDDSRPTISGMAEANATLIIYDKGKELDRVPVGADGKWSYTPENPLADGLHILSYSAVDLAGNIGQQTDVTEFIVDTRPEKINIFGAEDDVGSVTGDVFNGGITDDNYPMFFGSATAGGVVKIYEGGTQIGEGIAGVDGTWAITPTQALTQGAHVLHATVTLPAKGESPYSKPFNLTVSSEPSVTPTILTVVDDVGSITGNLAQGGITDDAKPEFSGKAEAGSTVTLWDKGAVIGTGTADANGKWSITPSNALSDEAHSITATAVNLVGNKSQASDAFVLTVDTLAPAKPTILTVTDDVGSITGTLAQGGATDDTKPQFKGKAEAGSTVTLWDNGVDIGSAKADASGNWTITSSKVLANDAHSVTAVAVDAAGNKSVASDAFGFTVDTVPPAKPTIVTVTDDVGSITGTLVQGGVTDDQRPTFSGKAEAGSAVSLWRGSQKIDQQTVIADADGNWTITVFEGDVWLLADGTHTITAIAVDAAGNKSVASDAFVLTVDTSQSMQTATVSSIGKDSGSSATDFLTNDGSAGRLMQGVLSAPLRVYQTLQVSTDGGKSWVTASVEGTQWSALDSNSHAESWDIQTRVVHEAGSIGVVKSRTVTLDTAAPAKPTILTVTDDVGSITGTLAQGGVTDDTQPQFKGKAEAGSTVTLWDNGVDIGNATADASGNWTITSSKVLANGAHSVTAVAVDAAGNKSVASDAFGFTVDTVPPAKPTILTVTDDVGPITGTLAQGGVTDDTKPQFKGKAEAGSKVTLWDNGVDIGNATADASGNWTITSSKVLANGAHSVTAVAVDAAGNKSVASDAFGFKVDTLPPTQTATLSSVGKDSGASNTDFLTNDGSAGRLMQGTLSAALSADEKLQVSTDGGKSWTAAFVQDKQWSAQDSNSHTDSWVIQMRVVGPAGTLGPASNQNVVLDTAAPGAPLSVSVKSSKVNVAFDGKKMVAGDRINIISGSQSMDYELTAGDIAAGKATVAPTIALGSDVLVAMVDKAGNVSGYRESDTTTQEIWNFDSYSVGTYLSASTPVSGSLGGSLSFQAYGSSMDASRGMVHNFNGMSKGIWIGAYPGWASNTTQTSIMTSGAFKLDKAADAVSFRLVAGNNNDGGPSVVTVIVVFYDAAGLEVGRTTTTGSASISSVSYTAPGGKQISSFTCYFPNDKQGVVFDDFVVTRNKAGEIVPAEVVHDIAYDAGGVFRGGIEDNLFKLADVAALGKVKIEGNGGVDTLKLLGSGQALDLSALVGKVSSVEVFDITGTGNNTLSLNLVNVLDNGAVNAFYKGDKDRVQLQVKGNAGDKVNLSDLVPNGADHGDWVKKASVVIGGVTYDAYQHSSLGAELLVQKGVSVTLDNHLQTRDMHDSVLGANAFAEPVGVLAASSLLSSVENELFASESTLLRQMVVTEPNAGGAGGSALSFGFDLLDTHLVAYAAY